MAFKDGHQVPNAGGNEMNQTEQILEHLKAGNSITPLEALNLFGCFRLSARIKDLRDAGYEIDTEYPLHVDRKRYAIYALKNAGKVAA